MRFLAFQSIRLSYKYLTADSRGRRKREQFIQSREQELSLPLIFGTHEAAQQYVVENCQAEQVDENVYERADVRFTIVAVPVN